MEQETVKENDELWPLWTSDRLFQAAKYAHDTYVKFRQEHPVDRQEHPIDSEVEPDGTSER